MKKSNARRVGALLVGFAILGVSACGSDDEAVTTEAPTSEAPSTDAPATGGELEGMKGTTPKGAEISEEWLAKVSDYWVSLGNTALADFNYAAEAYDAAIVVSLAVEIAGTDGAAHANEIVGITKGGTKCTTFADCMAIIAEGGDPDYDGLSGPHEFNGNGEPSKAATQCLNLDQTTKLLRSQTQI